MLHRNIEWTEWGYRAAVYDDVRHRIGYWYGTREACAAVNPRHVRTYPIEPDNSPDTFDLACERRHD